MDDRELLRQIDCRRADGRDADQPELAHLTPRAADDPCTADGARVAELLARGAAFDRRVMAALEDAPLPAGLEGRLLAALAAAEIHEELDSAAVVAVPADFAPASPALMSPAVAPLPRRCLTRRRWAYACGGIAAAAIVGLGAWALTPPTYTEEEVRERVLAFYLQDMAAAPSAKAVPSLPFSQQIAVAPRVARRVDGFLGQTAVAFDLRTRSGARATLYVAPVSVAGLPVVPPPRLGPVTGRQAVVAWQEGELLYVLVVEGGEREYPQFIHTPTIA